MIIEAYPLSWMLARLISLAELPRVLTHTDTEETIICSIIKISIARGIAHKFARLLLGYPPPHPHQCSCNGGHARLNICTLRVYGGVRAPRHGVCYCTTGIPGGEVFSSDCCFCRTPVGWTTAVCRALCAALQLVHLLNFHYSADILLTFGPRTIVCPDRGSDTCI